MGQRAHAKQGGHNFARPGGWQHADLPDATEAGAWFTGRLPSGWFTEPPEVIVDREEVTVIGKLAEPAVEGGKDVARAAAAGAVAKFREETRDARIQIAQEAEARYLRKVAWGVEIGGQRTVFTNVAVPVMTRLRQPERQVLDTLVDAGIARSRSDALAWCVKLVGEHTAEWLDKLREAMAQVENLRSEGPAL